MESNNNIDDVSSSKPLPIKKRKGDQDTIVDNAPKKKRIRPKCSAAGCNNNAKRGGVCIKHGANKLEHVLKKHALTCATDECKNKAYIEGGNCIKHGGKQLCSANGCTNIAKKGRVCAKHGAKVVRKICSHEGCDNYAQKRGVCKRHSPPDTEEAPVAAAASTLPDPIPSMCLPCNVDHKYDEETDDEVENETSDQPIEIKTEAIKEEEDTDYDDDDDSDMRRSINVCLPVKKEEDAYDMDTDDDEEDMMNVPDRCMSSNIKNEYDEGTDNEDDEYETSDHPVKTESVKEEDNAYN